jgi:hypothetical protein
VVQMDVTDFSTSRRSLLAALAATGTLPWCAVHIDARAPALKPFGSEEPPPLHRTREGRTLSRFRYQNAESFFLAVETGALRYQPEMLYLVGIVQQLGLSSFLLDVGFDDAWCARHIGLHVSKSLSYANATGLNANSPDLARLTAILSPYDKWRYADLLPFPLSDRLADDEIRHLTRSLLDQVSAATGHRRRCN